jgi:phenylacetate-CoA ligase
VQAIIVGANGSYVPGTFFAHLFKDYDHLVRQYQVVQERPGAIELRIIKGPRFHDAGFAEILEQLRQFLGQETAIDVQFVDEIPLVRNGKHQGAVSRLSIDFQAMQHDLHPLVKSRQ